MANVDFCKSKKKKKKRMSAKPNTLLLSFRKKVIHFSYTVGDECLSSNVIIKTVESQRKEWFNLFEVDLTSNFQNTVNNQNEIRTF